MLALSGFLPAFQLVDILWGTLPFLAGAGFTANSLRLTKRTKSSVDELRRQLDHMSSLHSKISERHSRLVDLVPEFHRELARFLYATFDCKTSDTVRVYRIRGDQDRSILLGWHTSSNLRSSIDGETSLWPIIKSMGQNRFACKTGNELRTTTGSLRSSCGIPAEEVADQTKSVMIGLIRDRATYKDDAFIVLEYQRALSPVVVRKLTKLLTLQEPLVSILINSWRDAERDPQFAKERRF